MDKEHIYFENYADTWDRDRKENPEKLQFLLKLARIRAGASVLDAGCGTGVLLPYISRAVGEGGTVTGLDYSRQMLDKARKKFSDLPGLSLVEGDVLKYDLPEQAYDAVVCLNFYPHISSRSRDFVKKMRRSLKVGGSLIVMHDMGRQQVNRIHDDRADRRLLPPADMLAADLVGGGFTLSAAVDWDDLYFVSVTKADEFSYDPYGRGGASAPAGSSHRSHTQKKAVVNRLARVGGHLEAIKRMVEDERDCSDVLVQLAAVDSAVVSVSKVILKDHIDHCLADAVRGNDLESVEKLKKAISIFVK
ncbi:metal-sensing transcriptional repressor [uncultured Megasphaera sp.]|uniref:metal-sensing transcriptional repressor n=1 Tax=uncultured Megasphaera sp. TaxID=165188 RepID=UPI00265D1D0F|nr:metal-sensing transcriptional repressor [uncultured Megasphaera sp.]